jgi:hypothetical protein
MSLLESLGEQLEPGEFGDFETGPPPRRPRPRWHVVVRGIVGLAMVAVPLVLVSLATPFSLGTVVGVTAGLHLYLSLAYYVRPRPASPTTGWRSVFANPFRYTDDIDWILWFLGVVLRPGRFASTAIVELLRRPLRSTVGG